MKKEEVVTRLDRIAEFSLCALIFTLPFSKSMVEIFFVAAFVCWVLKRCIEYSLQLTAYSLPDGCLRGKIWGLIKAFKPVGTNLNLPIAAFVFIGFLSTVKSVSLPLSLEGFFLKLFEWVMIYFIVVETINSRKRLNRILAVMLFSMALMIIDGMSQFTIGTDFIRNYPMEGYRMRGPFNSPNGFAGWLIVMVPLALSLACFVKSDWFDLPEKYKWLKKAMKPILWIVTGLLTVCLILTYTKGALMAFALSLIFFGILTAFVLSPAFRRIFSGNRLIMITGVIIILTLSFVAIDFTREGAISIMKSEEGSRFRGRLWREALAIIKDFPFVGCGLNTYATVAPRYKLYVEGGCYPHNSYLHMAAESGLLGLGAFIWILIALFRNSLASLKNIRNGFHNAVIIGLLTGLFGFLIHSSVDTNIYTLRLGNLMWFIMGLIVAVQKILGVDDR